MPERSALSPIETNDESPMPRAAASSIAAIPNAPLWEAKRDAPGVGAAGRERRVERDLVVAVGDAEAVRARPSACPPSRQTASSSSWRARALGPDLREARREDDERAHALGGAVARDVDDGVRRARR